MRFLEILAFSFCVLSIFYFMKAKQYRAIIVFSLAIGTVGVGEVLNHINSTTLYNEIFSMFPGSRLPLFIIPAGACLSAWIFQLCLYSEMILKLKNSRFISAVLISLFLPFLSEFIGVKLGIWKWNIPFEFSFFFLAGIWKFYALFIFSPIFIVFFLTKEPFANK